MSLHFQLNRKANSMEINKVTETFINSSRNISLNRATEKERRFIELCITLEFEMQAKVNQQMEN